MLMESNSQLTPEQKNLIFFFLQATDMDKTTEAEKEIITEVFEMGEYFEGINHEEFKIKANQLEEKILNLISKLKNQYFDYGAVAREISEYKLSEDRE
ncbi:hypothetical protein [Fusobacterium ulcerans]|uniref:hypothetical protein n=1 Tax=Fusobacterium ulcerans TaxID=861 RepID=UPI001031660B|nr:hypothetical protein [Fusobacterium ulcerans]